MEFLYIGIIIFLFCLAISDIIVGVSNDAVNFLNSAVGSKTAKFRNLIIIASIGVFLGASLSNASPATASSSRSISALPS